MSKCSIAIDGPAGAGKSTISEQVAKRLSFIHIDTGALYRTLAFYFLQNHIDANDIIKINECLEDIKIELLISDGVQKIKLFSNDISDKIRTPEVSMAASDFSAIPQVRKFLLNFQRNIAKEYNVIMDGRDIGTVVLKDASLKFFLTASCEERAKRRFKEFELKGIKVLYEDVLAEIKRRDLNDTNRTVAPLKPANDAIIIDSTNMSIEEVVDFIIKAVKGTSESF